MKGTRQTRCTIGGLLPRAALALCIPPVALAVPPPHESRPTGGWAPRPAIAPAGSIQRCEPWVRDGYASIQVNVDARGCNILGDAANEPSIAIDPTEPRKIVIGWRQFDSVKSSFRQAGYAYSHDGGHTWVFAGSLMPGTFGSDPVLATDPAGMFYYLSIDITEMRLFRSSVGGVKWEPPLRFPGSRDKPWMAIDLTEGPGRGNIYVNWADPYLLRCFDQAASCSDRSPMPAPLGFGTNVVAADGELILAGGTSGSEFVRLMRSSDAFDRQLDPNFSLSFPPVGGILALGAGGLNGEGIAAQVWLQTDLSDGPMHGTLYMLAPIVREGTDAHWVALFSSDDVGKTWSGPMRANDPLGPDTGYRWFTTMSVAPNGRIDVVWNDTRNDPTATYSELFYTFSEDGGVSWSDDITVSIPFAHAAGYPYLSPKLGDYYHMRSDNLGANVAYAATFNGEQDVYFLRIGPWDCNANEVPDEDDIAERTSLDANANEVPDECEYRGDADGDGLTTLRDYAAYQNCFGSEHIDPRLFPRRIRWCIPRRSSNLADDIGRRTRDRCNPTCGLADVDSDGAVYLPDLEGLTRVLSGP